MKCFGCELKKNFYFPYMLLPMLGTVVLCLAAPGEINEKGKEIAIFSLMLQGGAEVAGGIEKSALCLWIRGTGGWLNVFLPLLLTFGYIIQISVERQSGQMKFQLIRSGNLCYCTSKVLTGALTGGIFFVIGYVLFGVMMATAFPSLSIFSAEEQQFYFEAFFNNAVSLYIAKRLVGAFLYGVFASLYGIGVAVVFRDKYMMLCLPFLLNYIYQQIIYKIMITGYSRGTVSGLAESFYPGAVMELTLDKYQFIFFAVLFLMYIGVTILFYMSVKRSGCDGQRKYKNGTSHFIY